MDRNRERSHARTDGQGLTLSPSSRHKMGLILKMPCLVLPQGLCTCYSCCLEHFSKNLWPGTSLVVSSSNSELQYKGVWGSIPGQDTRPCHSEDPACCN